MKIGFIGNGWVGKNIADDFEERGYDVVRYSLEEPYCHNDIEIGSCDYVFVAVPTPTTKKGHDLSAVRSALKLIEPGCTVIIKSTVKPGTTFKLQEEFPDLIILHSPEFLTEKNVYNDVRHPQRNIIGMPLDENPWITMVYKVLHFLPKAPYELITSSTNAELIKYAGNAFLLTKVVFSNILYDLVQSYDGDWEEVRDAWTSDPRIGESHTKIFDENGKRGAAGHCLLKDFEVFREISEHNQTLAKIERTNLKYLTDSKKDLDLIEEIYETVC